MKLPIRISPLTHRHALTAIAALSLWGAPKAIAASYTWTGLGSSNNFSDDANWNSPGALPSVSNDYTFSGSSRRDVLLDTKAGSDTWQASSITFDSTAGSFNLGGYSSGTTGTIGNNRFSLGINSSITQNSAADQRISSVLYLATGTATVSGNGAGTLSLDAIRFHAGNDGAFIFNRSATIGTISSAASGSGKAQIILSSAGTLTFSQATTGSLTSIEINSNTEVGNAIAASNPGGLVSTASLGTLRNLAFQGTAKMEFQGGFTLGGNGSKTLTFSNTGGTTFSTKSVELGASGGTGSRAVTLEVTTGATATMASVVSGSNSTGATSLIKSGKGRLVLAVGNTYNGGTTVADGELLATNASGSATGTGNVLVTGGLLGGTGRIAPDTGAISITNGIVAVGHLNDAAQSGISQLVFTQGSGPVSFTLDSTSAIHLDLWSATDYERLVFNLDNITLGGASLVVDSTFAGLAQGQSYTLFDWGDTPPTGTFQEFILPTLDGGLSWDTSNLYLTGEISVIPEPGSVALAISLLGLGAIHTLYRRRDTFKLLPRHSSLLLIAGLALASSPLHANEASKPLLVAHEEAAVEKSGTLKHEFTVTATPVDHDLILEFTAWHQADKPSGFIQHMKVFLDGEELSDILDRPGTFTAKDEISRDIRGKHGWRVAILRDPEDPKNNESPYAVSTDEMPDITRFRFRLPQVANGTHEIEIRNLMRIDTQADGRPVYATLKIRDLAIVAVPK